MTPLLNKEQAAAILGWSPRTLDRRANENQPPRFIKVGRLRKYKTEDLQSFMDNCPSGGEPIPEAA